MIEKNDGGDELFKYATEGILIADSSGNIMRCNPSLEKLFGYMNNELLGKPVEVLIPKRFSNSHQQHRSHYAHQPIPRSMGKGMNLFGIKKDGSEFPVEVSLSPFSNPNGNFVIAFIIDTTLRHQAEEKQRSYSVELENQVKKRTLILEEAINELEKTKGELHEALAKERELNELKSRFVSMASHEFRTPLATILSSLSLVTKYGSLNELEKQRTHINKIKSSISNLVDILNDFLSVSKLEEGKEQFMPESLNLESFIDEIIADLQLATKEGQKIIYLHSGVSYVNTDKKMLRHILFNLINNAIKFSPDNSQILVTSQASYTEFLLEVTDRGVGIPEEDQKHLFERFFRANNATHIQGTGLGLNIVARYIELMNGTIECTSKENVGTTFTISFKP